MNELVVLTAIVMLPLIPAFLLFKLLPSRAVVKGPLAGLDVSLGGAFGGYVALTVFVATFFANEEATTPAPQSTVLVGIVSSAASRSAVGRTRTRDSSM